jgi:hypothetical protein
LLQGDIIVVDDCVHTPSVNVIEYSEDSEIQIPGMTVAFMEMLKQNYNYSQLKAIELSSQGEGFVLVQGPPGSGSAHSISDSIILILLSVF